MRGAAAIVEKHEGALDDGRATVRLWLRLLSCTMVIEKRLRRRLADRHATTLPRFDVLAALDRAEDGLTMGGIGRALLVSNGNVTGVVQSLEREGLVEIVPCPRDGRASLVQLTAAGRASFTAMAADHRDWIDGVFAGLSESERVELHRLLGRLKMSIAEEGAPHP